MIKVTMYKTIPEGYLVWFTIGNTRVKMQIAESPAEKFATMSAYLADLLGKELAA